MTDRLPGKYKQNLHSRPWFFSGKVPDIKYSYTQSGLTPSSYPIRPRSIVPGKRIDLQPVKSGFLNVDEKKEEHNSRQFREYSFLKENEVLLTIEHCDNCEEHSNTTRHDPVKYFQTAQSLKNAVLARYPMVKVIVKPVSKLDPLVCAQRMGAFEVQVSNKTKGRLNVEVLHSKLTSRKWPDVAEVTSKIAGFLPTFQLFVTVFDELSQEKTLKGLKVFIKPKPVDLEVPRMNSHYSSFRPKSAATARSVKSLRAMSSRRLSQKNLSKVKKNTVFERVTDRDGTCLFDNIPFDIYEIEVEGTKEHKGTVKTFNTFEEKIYNSSFNIYVSVKSRENSNVTVILKDVLLKEGVTNAKVSLNKEAEQFFLTEVRKGVYEISLPKGDYQLNVLTSKYKEIVKNISAYDVETVQTENLELKKNKEIAVFTYDALTGNSLNGVLIEMVINNHISFEGITKSGKYAFQLDESGSFMIKSYLTGYIKSKVSLVINNDTSSIYLPLVPSSIDHPLIVISWCKCSDDLEVQAMSDLPLTLKTPEIDGFFLKDFLKSHGFASISILGDFKDLRVTVKGLTKELISFNGFMHSGVNAQFYAWKKNISSIKPVSGTGEYWDIGIFSSKHRDFIEVNMISNYQLESADLLREYTSVIRLIQCTDDLHKVFGFSHAVSKMMSYGKDLFVSPEIFKKTLQGTISEEFLNSFVQNLTSTDGVSLSLLMNRYQRYVGIGKTPFKKLEQFMEAIGMDPKEDFSYKSLAEEGFLASLPGNWEVVFDEDGEVLYRSSQNEISKELPNVQIYRKKLFDFKKADIKKKNIEKVIKKKSIDVASKKSSEIVRKRNDMSRSESDVSRDSRSSNNKHIKPYEAKEKSPKSSSSENTEEISNFIKNVNEQCEKLAEFAIKNIEFYNKNGQLDDEIQQQLLEKISEHQENFKTYLEQELHHEHKEFFEFWNTKFAEIKSSLSLISEKAKGKNRVKSIKSSSSSSSSSSSHSEY